MSDELTELQKLSIAQALYKKLAQIVSTKDPDSIRAMVDDTIRANYESTGAKSYDIMLMGDKVGTISVKSSKASKSVDLHIVDMDAYVQWCIQNSCIDTDDAQAKRKFLETGELPDGCEVVEYEKPAGYSGTVLRIEEDTIIDMVRERGLFESVDRLLIGDGSDG